jgi:hypothetical protein
VDNSSSGAMAMSALLIYHSGNVPGRRLKSLRRIWSGLLGQRTLGGHAGKMSCLDLGRNADVLLGYIKSRTRGNRLRLFARHRDCGLFSALVEIDIVRAAGSDDVPSMDLQRACTQ